MNRFFQFLSLGLIVLLSNITSVTAQTCTWNGSVNKDWSTAGNWTGGVPTSTSDVVINGFSGIMSKSGGSCAPSIRSLSISNSTIELGLNFTGITVTGNSAITPTYTFKIVSSSITPQSTSFALNINGGAPVVITSSSLGNTTTSPKYAVTINNTNLES